MKRALLFALVVCLSLGACGGPATPDSTDVARLIDEAVCATVAVMSAAGGPSLAPSTTAAWPSTPVGESIPAGLIDRRQSLDLLLPTTCSTTGTCQQEAQEIVTIVVACPSAAIYEFDSQCSHTWTVTDTFFLPAEAMRFGGKLDWVFNDSHLSNLIIAPVGDGSWRVTYEYCAPTGLTDAGAVQMATSVPAAQVTSSPPPGTASDSGSTPTPTRDPLLFPQDAFGDFAATSAAIKALFEETNWLPDFPIHQIELSVLPHADVKRLYGDEVPGLWSATVYRNVTIRERYEAEQNGRGYGRSWVVVRVSFLKTLYEPDKTDYGLSDEPVWQETYATFFLQAGQICEVAELQGYTSNSNNALAFHAWNAVALRLADPNLPHCTDFVLD